MMAVLDAVVRALRAAHPYEEPAFMILAGERASVAGVGALPGRFGARPNFG